MKCPLSLAGGMTALMVSATVVTAAERPLWELAGGGGVISLPYYRGAEENRVLPVPFVYPVYRGDVLRVDEEGIRGLFIESERMASCLYDPADCESERTVIISELHGGDNDPDTLLDQELTAPFLFPLLRGEPLEDRPDAAPGGLDRVQFRRLGPQRK